MEIGPLRVAVLSVHTCPLAPPGGWETGGMNVYIRELSRELGQRGIQVDIFTRRQDPRSEDVVPISENARVIHLEAGPRRTIDKYDVVDYLPEFTCNLQRFRALNGLAYDLIHAHYWLSGRVASVLKQVWDVPLVAMFHTMGRVKNRLGPDAGEREPELRAEIETRMMAAANRIVAATDVDRADMLRLYQAPAHKIAVIPGGVDLDLFHPMDMRQARSTLRLPGRSPIVLFVGRMQPLKGLDILLEAVARLPRASAPQLDAHVVVVGGLPPHTQGRRAAEDRQTQRLGKLAAQLGLADRVHFMGAVKQHVLPLYYSAADVTVMPSEYESFGLVALESLACGTPVVATRVGGLTAIVRDRENGFLVPWRDPDLFAERIGALLELPTLRRHMSQEALKSAQRFSWQAVGDQMTGLYRQVIGPSASKALAER